MNYTKSERERIKKVINPIEFEVMDKSYENFIGWYQDKSIDSKHKSVLCDQLILTATPSLMYPQYIRLEIIEYWKEKFFNYDFICGLFENIN
jgi:hypothetical protein